MKKDEVKLLMKQNQVKQWEVAEAMEISEFTLCRWLRKDLDIVHLTKKNLKRIGASKTIQSMADISMSKELDQRLRMILS